MFKNIKHIFSFIPFCLLLNHCVFAQKPLVDSLSKLLIENQHDTLRADRMIKLAMAYEAIDTTLAIKKYKETIGFTKKANLRLYEAKAYRYFAGYYSLNKNDKENLKNLIFAFKTLKGIKNKKSYLEMASILGDFGSYYSDQNETQKAIFFFHKSIRIGEIFNIKSLCIYYINLSRVYQSNGSKKFQLEYLLKGLNNAKFHKNNTIIFAGYYMLANYYVELKDYKKAEKLIDSCSLYEKYNNNFSTKLGYFLISGLVSQQNNNINEAKIAYQKGLALAKSYNYEYYYNQPELQLIYLNIIGNKLYGLDERLSQALLRANKFDMKKEKEEVYEYLADINYTNKNYKAAFDYYEKFHKTKDTLVGLEKSNLVSSLEVKYQSSQKDLDIQKKSLVLSQKESNIKLLSLGLLSVFAIGVIGFLFYQNRLKLKNKELSHLRQANQLTATESILKGQEEERGRLARDLHDGLGGLLSGIKLNLNNMNGNVILTEQNANGFQRAIGQLDEAIVEMRRVAHSMMPEALLKFGLVDAIRDFSENISQVGKVKVHFQTVGIGTERFAENVEITLYRIVQELVNNTLKHAKAADMYIQLAKTDDLLTLTAEDNGVGFDINVIKEGIGLKNIKNRVEYLSGKLDIRSEIGKGSSFLIEVKI